MAYRWKDRSVTPGDYNWVAGSLGFAPAAANVLSTDAIGDGTAGTYHVALTTEVKSGVTFGPSQTLTGTFSPSPGPGVDVSVASEHSTIGSEGNLIDVVNVNVVGL
jgi:hypothetical protein